MKTVLMVKGTHCSSCKMLIEDVCADVPGVVSCTVDFKTGKVVLDHDAALDLKKVKKEIEALGEYKVQFLGK